MSDSTICGFCEGDPCRCATTPAPKALKPDSLLRLGAATLEAERSLAVEELLDDQEATYRRILATEGPEPLIEALLDRDRLLANQGRQLADGRMGSRLLREFVRAVLYQAEAGAGGGKGQARLLVDQVLQRLGGEVADARQVRMHGSTLGPLESPEAQARRAEELASGRRKE